MRVFEELEDVYNIKLWITYSSLHKDLLLSQLVIPKDNRNKGLGSKIMKIIIEHADKNQLNIRLTPDDSLGATSINRLKKFYKRFGFIENKGQYRFSETMYREAKGFKNV